MVKQSFASVWHPWQRAPDCNKIHPAVELGDLGPACTHHSPSHFAAYERLGKSIGDTEPSYMSVIMDQVMTGWWFGYFFPFHIWDNPSHWLSYFSRWLKPPTGWCDVYIFSLESLGFLFETGRPSANSRHPWMKPTPDVVLPQSKVKPKWCRPKLAAMPKGKPKLLPPGFQLVKREEKKGFWEGKWLLWLLVSSCKTKLAMEKWSCLLGRSGQLLYKWVI